MTTAATSRRRPRNTLSSGRHLDPHGGGPICCRWVLPLRSPNVVHLSESVLSASALAFLASPLVLLLPRSLNFLAHFLVLSLTDRCTDPPVEVVSWRLDAALRLGRTRCACVPPAATPLVVLLPVEFSRTRFPCVPPAAKTSVEGRLGLSGKVEELNEFAKVIPPTTSFLTTPAAITSDSGPAVTVLPHTSDGQDSPKNVRELNATLRPPVAVTRLSLPFGNENGAPVLMAKLRAPCSARIVFRLPITLSATFPMPSPAEMSMSTGSRPGWALALPPRLAARLKVPLPASTVLTAPSVALPTLMARLKASTTSSSSCSKPAVAETLLPTAMAAFNCPSAVADVPGPSPSAKLKKVALQWPPLRSLMLMPKMPTHVASAFGTSPSDAAAIAAATPDTTAPRIKQLASLPFKCFEISPRLSMVCTRLPFQHLDR